MSLTKYLLHIVVLEITFKDRKNFFEQDIQIKLIYI